MDPFELHCGHPLTSNRSTKRCHFGHCMCTPRDQSGLHARGCMVIDRTRPSRDRTLIESVALWNDRFILASCTLDDANTCTWQDLCWLVWLPHVGELSVHSNLALATSIAHLHFIAPNSIRRVRTCLGKDRCTTQRANCTHAFKFDIDAGRQAAAKHGSAYALNGEP